MNKISVVIIVKNGEDFIEKALKSAEWADEILVLDSGSSDKTIEIAKKYTDNIHFSETWPGFGKQRQNAQKLCSSRWIFMLDADEEISEELKHSIKKAIEDDDSIYMVNRLSKAFGQQVKHSGWYPDWICRLYPNKLTRYNDILVHESLVIPDGFRPKKLKGNLYHETYKDMKDYYQKMSMYIDAWSTQNFQKKRGGSLIGLLRGLWAFVKMYIFQLGFLDRSVGLTLALLRFETTIMKYVDLKIKKTNSKAS
tara:strand:+ start:336 stop:1094 length:759 start_codon:yes stop_codon:yes gene_type:complete